MPAAKEPVTIGLIQAAASAFPPKISRQPWPRPNRRRKTGRKSSARRNCSCLPIFSPERGPQKPRHDRADPRPDDGGVSAQSCDHKRLLRCLGQSYRPRSPGRQGRHLVLGAKFYRRHVRRNHRQCRPRRNGLALRDRLGQSGCDPHTLAVPARPAHRCVRRFRLQIDR